MKRAFWAILTRVRCKISSNFKRSNLIKIVTIIGAALLDGISAHRSMVTAKVTNKIRAQPIAPAATEISP
jgi:hypothetical protein